MFFNIFDFSLSDEEMKKYYEEHKADYYKDEVKASHILISTVDDNGKELSEAKKKEAKKKAEEVLKKAKSGEEFSELAKEYSDDSSASKGGDLGYFTQDEMVSAFSKAAFSLKTGEIYNKVVETSSGYHIIKKTGEKDQDFDDVKDDLIKTLESTKQSTLMQDLYTKYDVQIKNQ